MNNADFNDLLQSAEQLSAECGDVLQTDLPRVERNLSQLVEAGQQLFSKTGFDVGGARAAGGAGGGAQSQQQRQRQQEVKAAILLGARGVDLPGLQSQLQSLSSGAAASAAAAASASLTAGVGLSAEPVRDTDVAGFLRHERENALLSVIEETRKETFEHVERLHWDSLCSDWQADKRRILQALSGGGGGAGGGAGDDLMDMTRSGVRPEVSRLHHTLPRSSLDHAEMSYAEHVLRYNEAVTSSGAGGVNPDLVDTFAGLFPEEREPEVHVMWEMVRAMSDLPAPTPAASASALQSAKWRAGVATDVVAQSRRYLEAAFHKFVQSTVYSNLQNAQLGGVPGTFQLVRSFLKVKIPADTPGLEDGLIDGAPVWAMIYYCLRCGDLPAAIQSASQAGPGLAEVVSYLNEIHSSADHRLSAHTEHVVRLCYRRSVRSTTDPFKRVVYCLLGACDPSDEHGEIATSIDDYLWLKLYQIRDDDGAASAEPDHLNASGATGPGTDTLTLAQLQTLMSEDYGEAHFNAYEQPVLYFQVLLLTGQLEAAVDFLFRVDRLRSHAVHIALSLYEKHLLLLPTNIQAAMLSKELTDKNPVRRLNLARMVMLYVRKFEATDPKEALHYFYFLRHLRGARNDNLFMSCVSELVLESREFDLLLGRLLQDGSRAPGLVDRLSGTNAGGGGANVGDTQKVIELVAQESEQKGMFEDSVKLYDLARKHEKVMELLNKLLAQVISQPNVRESRRDRLQRQGVDIAQRYRTQGHSASKDSTSTFFLLLDLMTFFDLYQAKKYDEAVDTIEKIKIIPLCQRDLDSLVVDFRVLQDEIRRNVPDLLLATMNILFSQYKQTKGSTPGRGAGQDGGRERKMHTLRERAKALITFAGMIPYRMPGDTNARLVQMEVLMN